METAKFFLIFLLLSLALSYDVTPVTFEQAAMEKLHVPDEIEDSL